MAHHESTRSALLEEALAFGGPIIVFDHVNLGHQIQPPARRNAPDGAAKNSNVRRSEISQTKTSCNLSKSVGFRFRNFKQRRNAFPANISRSARLTGVFRWRLRTQISGAVILSERRISDCFCWAIPNNN